MIAKIIVFVSGIQVISYIQAVDKHGITPILAAIWEGHTNCVKILLDAGVPKTGKTPDGLDYLEAADKADIKALLSA